MKTRPKVSRLSITKVVEALLETGCRKATVFQHPRLVVKGTRRFPPDARCKSETLLLTIGAPNYRERKLIRIVGPFPVKKVILQHYPA